MARRRTIEVDTMVTAEVDMEEISTQELCDELAARQGGDASAGMTVLQRIVWEHDVLGLPLADVVDGLMHEHAIVRGSASAALAGVE